MTKELKLSQVEALSRDDLIRIVNRDRVVKDMLVSRLAAVVAENAELMAYVQELQGEPQPATRPADGPVEASESPSADGAVPARE